MHPRPLTYTAFGLELALEVDLDDNDKYYVVTMAQNPDWDRPVQIRVRHHIDEALNQTIAYTIIHTATYRHEYADTWPEALALAGQWLYELATPEGQDPRFDATYPRWIVAE